MGRPLTKEDAGDRVTMGYKKRNAESYHTTQITKKEGKRPALDGSCFNVQLLCIYSTVWALGSVGIYIYRAHYKYQQTTSNKADFRAYNELSTIKYCSLIRYVEYELLECLLDLFLLTLMILYLMNFDLILELFVFFKVYVSPTSLIFLLPFLIN